MQKGMGQAMTLAPSKQLVRDAPCMEDAACTPHPHGHHHPSTSTHPVTLFSHYVSLSRLTSSSQHTDHTYTLRASLTSLLDFSSLVLRTPLKRQQDIDAHNSTSLHALHRTALITAHSHGPINTRQFLCDVCVLHAFTC